MSDNYQYALITLQISVKPGELRCLVEGIMNVSGVENELQHVDPIDHEWICQLNVFSVTPYGIQQ